MTKIDSTPGEDDPQPAPDRKRKGASSRHERVRSPSAGCVRCEQPLPPGEWLGCGSCKARHHFACWDEAAKCSRCGSTDAQQRWRYRTTRVLMVFVGVAILVAGNANWRLLRYVEGRDLADVWKLRGFEPLLETVQVTSGIAFMAIVLWFALSYANLWALRAGNEASRFGWGVGAWLVPIVNLFVPLILGHVIWTNSKARQEGERAPMSPLVVVMWLTSLVSFLTQFLLLRGGPVLAGAAAVVVANIVMVMFMFQASSRQAARWAELRGPAPGWRGRTPELGIVLVGTAVLIAFAPSSLIAPSPGATTMEPARLDADEVKEYRSLFDAAPLLQADELARRLGELPALAPALEEEMLEASLRSPAWKDIEKQPTPEGARRYARAVIALRRTGAPRLPKVLRSGAQRVADGLCSKTATLDDAERLDAFAFLDEAMNGEMVDPARATMRRHLLAASLNRSVKSAAALVLADGYAPIPWGLDELSKTIDPSAFEQLERDLPRSEATRRTRLLVQALRLATTDPLAARKALDAIGGASADRVKAQWRARELVSALDAALAIEAPTTEQRAQRRETAKGLMELVSQALPTMDRSRILRSVDRAVASGDVDVTLGAVLRGLHQVEAELVEAAAGAALIDRAAASIRREALLRAVVVTLRWASPHRPDPGAIVPLLKRVARDEAPDMVPVMAVAGAYLPYERGTPSPWVAPARAFHERAVQELLTVLPTDPRLKDETFAAAAVIVARNKGDKPRARELMEHALAGRPRWSAPWLESLRASLAE